MGVSCMLFGSFEEYINQYVNRPNPEIEKVKQYLNKIRCFIYNDEDRLQTFCTSDSEAVLELLSSAGVECGKLFHESVWFYLNKRTLAALEAAI